MGKFHILVYSMGFVAYQSTTYEAKIGPMKDEYDTNLGWWTDKPDREPRTSSFTPISGPFHRRRTERVWIKAVLIVALMAGFGWSLLNLARAMG